MEIDSNIITFKPVKHLEPPKIVGGYVVNKNLNFMVFYQKPCLFHRFMTKLLLGWEWKDENI